MKKAIILARVSTPDQERTGLSIPDIQLPQMREYAKEKGFIVEKEHEYVFQETATQKLRKNFDEVIDFVKKNNDIKAIIAFRVDRMTRNYRDAVEVDKLRIEYGKELHFVSDRLILDENSVGRDIQDWDLKVFLAKQHINRCEEDAQYTLNTKLKDGDTYGKAPYGYINISKEEWLKNPSLPRVMIDEYRAGIVRIIFDLYTTGADSYLSIAKKMTIDYPQEFPSLKMAKRKVENVLTNMYYAGFREYKGVVYSHKFETIISKEIFDIANEKRLGRARNKDKKKKDNNDHSTYGGFITCAECGCTFSPDKNRHAKMGREVKSDYYYYCTNSRREHDKKPIGTNDAKLTKQIAELFKQMQVPQEDLQGVTKTLTESHQGKIRFTEEETKKCRQEIDRYQKMIENAYEDKCAGRITQEQYDKFQTKWRELQDKDQTKLDKIMNADKEYYITASYLLELASRSYELFLGSEPEQKRQLLGLIFENLSVKDGNLCYVMAKPFDSIFKTAGSHMMGGIWDSNP